jgi:CHASE3 domain sensor protein/putative methionine-R-sulfoxide reductase with GAF domain
MVIKKFKENFISLSLTLLIVLILLNATLIFYNRSVMVTNNVLQKQTEEVKKAWAEIFESNLRRMDLGLRGYAITRNPQLLDPYVTGKKDMPRTMARIDSLLTVQKLDSLKLQFDIFEPKVEAYIKYAEEMENKARNEDLEGFKILLNEDRGYDLWQAFAPMFSFINNYQDKLVDEARASYQQAMDRNVIFQVFLVLLTIPTMIGVMLRIRRDTRNRRKLLADFDKNNRQYLFDSGEALSADNPQVIIQSSIRNLKKASSFIKDIAGGNYGVTWEGLSTENAAFNQDNLAGDLIKMRDQMKKVKELDEKRIWSTEGLAKFSDVARNNQNNIEKLSNEVIRFLTKHMKAQQGTLFVLQDEEGEEPHLELAACYAFDKKKFIEKKIDIGSGMIGQAYLEGSTQLMTAVPKGYIRITSGLGDATPTCVIIVPMKYNERVEAVLELASFNRFEPHEVEFLEKAGEVIASSIYATKTNERTAKLLKETQHQAEALRSQEEELRQNMEELQATQEDMRRREIETPKREKVVKLK